MVFLTAKINQSKHKNNYFIIHRFKVQKIIPSFLFVLNLINARALDNINNIRFWQVSEWLIKSKKFNIIIRNSFLALE